MNDELANSEGIGEDAGGKKKAIREAKAQRVGLRQQRAAATTDEAKAAVKMELKTVNEKIRTLKGKVEGSGEGTNSAGKVRKRKKIEGAEPISG